MTKIKGVELDINKSSSSEFGWSMYFTDGSFMIGNQSKQTTPFIINLDQSEYKCDSVAPCLYNVYMNPLNNNIKIADATETENKTCSSFGYLIGGFQIKGCKLFFVRPKSTDDTKYPICHPERIFSKEFDKSFTVTEYKCDDNTCQGDFNIKAFSKSFDTECVITHGDGGAFMRANFDNGFK